MSLEVKCCWEIDNSECLRGFDVYNFLSNPPTPVDIEDLALRAAILDECQYFKIFFSRTVVLRKLFDI